MFKTNPTLFYLIVCGMVFLIIAINVSLFSMVKNRSIEKQMKMMKNAFQRAKSPWGDEDKNLDELSELVKKVAPSSSTSTDDSETDQNQNNGK
jgi:uncharacterized membrane protein SpoIIM required for sporulation